MTYPLNDLSGSARTPDTRTAELAQTLHDAACGCGDSHASVNSYWLKIARAAVKELRSDPAPERAEPDLYHRPHSRACGWRAHPHGSECHSNCPTCGGKA